MLALAHSAPWTQEAQKLYRKDNIWGLCTAKMAHTQATALREKDTTRVLDL